MSSHDNPMTPADQAPLLQITDLEVAFRSSTGLVPAVRGANLTLYPGQSVAVVGESGDDRSEERRVGKECRSRWSPYH